MKQEEDEELLFDQLKNKWSETSKDYPTNK